MTIGARLKAERERLRKTQEEFAAVGHGTKRSQINWEQGVAMPNAAYLAAIAAIGADVAYIVTGVVAPTRANDATSHHLAAEPAAAEPSPTGAKVPTSALLANEPAPTEAKLPTSATLPAGLPPREQELLRRYRAMSERDRVLVDGITLHMIEREARLASESGPVSHPVRLRRRRDDRRKEGTSGT